MLNTIGKDPLLRGSGHRLLVFWKPLLMWYALAGVFLLLLLSPFLSWALRHELLRGDTPVVANIDLLEWALSGRGFLNLCLLISVGLMTTVVRFSGIFLIINAHVDGHALGTTLLFRRVLRLLPRLFKLCLLLACSGLIWALLFGGGVFGIYQLFLSEYDINYYISQRPQEFYYAVASLIVWLLVCLAPTLLLLGRLLIVLPASLSGDYRLLSAVREAWRLPGKRAWRLLRMMAVLIIGAWFFQFLINTLAIVVARTLLCFAPVGIGQRLQIG